MILIITNKMTMHYSHFSCSIVGKTESASGAQLVRDFALCKRKISLLFVLQGR
jgi:hypothetical protein